MNNLKENIRIRMSTHKIHGKATVLQTENKSIKSSRTFGFLDIIRTWLLQTQFLKRLSYHKHPATGRLSPRPAGLNPPTLPNSLRKMQTL